MKTITKVIALVSVLILTSGCSILSSQLQGSTTLEKVPVETTRTINVTGTGIILATPDIAYLNIGVHTEDYDADSAVNQNNEITRKVKDALKEYGVEDKDIQTSNFSIYLQAPYSGVQGESSKIMVDNTVLVTVRNLNDLSKMLGEAIRSGANNVYGITFDIVDKATIKDQARTEAMEDASKQALQLAVLSGGKPGKVLSVTVVTNNIPNPYYGSGMGGGSGMVNNTNVPVSAGSTTISIDVNVVYELTED